jgi:undecaprenyl-diphosphatase
MLWPQIAACSVLVSHQKYLKAFLLVFFTQGTFYLNELIKNFVCRQRPCDYYGYSFPSNHAAVEMCFYGICIYLILRYTRNEFWRYFLALVFGIFIFLVCLSRLWLGVHFLTDIIAGLSLGIIMINLYIITIKAFGE